MFARRHIGKRAVTLSGKVKQKIPVCLYNDPPSLMIIH